VESSSRNLADMNERNHLSPDDEDAAVAGVFFDAPRGPGDHDVAGEETEEHDGSDEDRPCECRERHLGGDADRG